MKKDEVGVIIGRFQPFHTGHVWLIKKTLERFDKIIILIGSSNITDEKNPWSLELRKKAIFKFIEKEKISKRVLKVTDVIDVPDDDKWLDIALEKIGTEKFIVIGDNDWVNGIFEKKRYEVWRTGYFMREKYEGTKIRKLFIEKKNWEDRVPEYVVRLLKT